MSSPATVAEFSFTANKSFVTGGGYPITVPSRYYQLLKESGLLESRPAVVTFRDGPRMGGMIHTSWRAGGRYYQIRVTKSEATPEIAGVKLGTVLRVRVLRGSEDWLVELK